MSTVKVNTIDNNGSNVDFPNKLTVRGNAIEQGYTASGTEPSSPSEGDYWYDTVNKVLYQYINSEFKTISLAAGGNAWSGDRGIIAGGEQSNNGSSINNINYFDITTAGNTADFGDLTNTREHCAGLSNKTRGVICGGNSSGSRQNVMDYVTIATAGNATDFGDLTSAKSAVGASSNGTVGIICGGYGSGSYPSSYKNEIESITVATTGNATDFGDMTYQGQMLTSTGDATRGIIAGGYTTAAAGDVTINYITYASAGNATDFGDLTVGRYTAGSCSDATRACIGGGGSPSSNGQASIDYITIQTTGNAADFGDMTQGRTPSAVANQTRGVFCVGDENTTFHNILDYITIQTLGNATDFGDNTISVGKTAACSGNAS